MPFRRAEILQELDHLEIRLQRFGRKSREILSQVVRVIELHVLGDLAGEEALPERAPCDEANPKLFANRKLCCFGLAHPQGVVVLDRR